MLALRRVLALFAICGLLALGTGCTGVLKACAKIAPKIAAKAGGAGAKGVAKGAAAKGVGVAGLRAARRTRSSASAIAGLSATISS